MNRTLLTMAAMFIATVCTLGFGGRAEAADGTILVAYFSYQGHTAGVAREIAAQTGGDLFEIKPVTPYPAYDECLEVAKAERENNARPAFEGSVENMAEYDVVFVGYPIWWYDAPMIVLTFLEGSDLSGKTVIPFNTHAGSRDGGTYRTVRDMEPDAAVLDGLAVNGESVGKSEDQVRDWLAGLAW